MKIHIKQQKKNIVYLYIRTLWNKAKINYSGKLPATQMYYLALNQLAKLHMTSLYTANVKNAALFSVEML